MKLFALFAAGMLMGLELHAAQESSLFGYDDAGRLTAAYVSQGASNSAALFAYDLAGNRIRSSAYAPAASEDLDGDGLNDPFSIEYFGALGAGGANDPDGDGLANSNECAAAGNPLKDDTDGDRMKDLEEFIAGSALNDNTDYFAVANTLPFGSSLRILFEAHAGRTYLLKKTGNLMSDWSDQGSAYSASADGSHYFDVTASTNMHYRLEVHVTNP